MVPVEHIFIEEIKKAEEPFKFFRTISNHVLSDLPVKEMAPALGFEPRTKWLTATYSTAELCRSVSKFLNIVRFEEKGKLKIEKIWTFFLKNAIFQASGNSSCGGNHGSAHPIR